MNAKMSADEFAGAEALSSDDLTEVQGGQEEIAIVPFLVGYVAGKAIDYAYDSFSEWSSTVTHAPYTDSYAQAIDANNQAELQQEMVQQMDQMSGQGPQGGHDQGGQGDHGVQGNQGNHSGGGDGGGYPSNGGNWQYGGGYGG
jgi:hypothetical protein